MIRAKINDILSNKNEIDIFRCVFNNKNISRNEIAQKLNVSNSTIINAVDKLIDRNIIISNGVISGNRGRNISTLDINKEIFVSIGITITIKYISVNLIDLSGKSINKYDFDFLPTTWEDNFENIYQSIYKHIKLSEKKQLYLLGIGISRPGFIEYENRNLNFPDELYNWNTEEIKKTFEEKFNIGFKIGSIPSVILLGESYFGIGTDYKDIVCINIGNNGIGWGHMRDGIIDKKVDAYPNSFGKNIIGLNFSNNSATQKFETLENSIGKKGVEDSYKEALIMNGLDNAPSASYEEILSAADKGDFIALQVVSKVASYLGFSLASLLTAIHPDLCILSGILLEYNNLIFDMSINIAQKHISEIADIKIDFGKVHSMSPLASVDKDNKMIYSTATGAATLVFQEFFEN